MPTSRPLYAQLQTQLDRYSDAPMAPAAVSDLLTTVAMELASDHPHAARHLMVEADVAQKANA